MLFQCCSMDCHINLICTIWRSLRTTYTLHCVEWGLRKIAERLLIRLCRVQSPWWITLLKSIRSLIIDYLTNFVLWKLFKHLPLLFNILSILVQSSSICAMISSNTLRRVWKTCSTFASPVISGLIEILSRWVSTCEHLMILPLINRDVFILGKLTSCSLLCLYLTL